MSLTYKKVQQRDLDVSVIYIAEEGTDFTDYSFTTTELEYVKKQLKDNRTNSVDINSYFKWSYIRVFSYDEEYFASLEEMRKEACKIYSRIRENQHREILVVDVSNRPEMVHAFLEGLGLGYYEFKKYRKQNNNHRLLLEKIQVLSDGISESELNRLEIVCKAVYHARDMVNEPLNALNAIQLSERFKVLGREAGFSVEVFNKKKIETLKLNGLLAVNKGSLDPPSFTIMEWKPKNPVNKKPVILVGKGVVYDTGGMSLKPASYMKGMKSDMAGAATVGGALFAIASNNLPYHVIGLVPATDNRPDGNAYVPGDIITMHSGKTVEVINTDAEGRMILADALSFARQYDPELVIDFATLTGSASVAIGPLGMVGMGNAENEVFDKLIESGNNTYERIVRLPLWKEYGEMIKSDIADIKNVGGREAGAITAGKFLENFIDYPWIHLDIAPTAFLEKPDSYRGKGGTGIGVRLIFDFINHYYK